MTPAQPQSPLNALKQYVLWLLYSRKAKNTIIAILGILTAFYTDTITAQTAVLSILSLIISLNGFIAYEDGKTQEAIGNYLDKEPN